MADAMIRLQTDPRRQPALGILAAGTAMLVVGLAPTLATGGDWVWLAPLLIGVAMAGIGLFRLVNGSPPLKTGELKAKWEGCGKSS